MPEIVKVFEIIIRSFLMVFVAIYGIVSLGIYVDDKVSHSEGIWDFFGALLVLILCSFM